MRWRMNTNLTVRSIGGGLNADFCLHPVESTLYFKPLLQIGESELLNSL
jgi:hypothetical protein